VTSEYCALFAFPHNEAGVECVKWMKSALILRLLRGGVEMRDCDALREVVAEMSI
jgi:hypothetical protein